ncbi:MarR family transcriptional regulator [Escherichia coli]|uniref:helix-turn-helix domain-containing protein n=1 Tax=Enterobacteriaceae TaxID=543 RepID=UPI0007D6F6F4|nr:MULTISPECIES: helix-turn-helix domain-containing protein [Enterobacteriaceae]EFB9779714.1 MarR family transcriptional regulator [Escherichia coli]EHP8044846.1 MarR family transcriptional regulator [Escherichia coli]EMA2745141.1 MarR family transcriptional regulator [Escherichia coli]MBS9562956.1 MarR family transcriptional regulator [Escherichia coli]MBS9590275.1 MarR family transcriptional regulator [Escherichia coli]
MSNTSVMLTKEQKAIIAEALDVMPEDLEEIKVKASACKKTSFRDDFSMVFKDNTATLARMDLTPTAFRIVLYLFSAIDYGNIIPGFSQSRTARELGLNKSNVSRAFRELFERKILIRNAEDGQVYLNSNLCVKGIPHRFNEDLMDKFSKSRLETEDFATSFNFYRARRKTKPVKKSRNRYPTDGIPF